jgi:prophage endopeptidase
VIASKAYLYVIAGLSVTCIGLAGSVMHAQGQRDDARTALAEYRGAVAEATAKAQAAAREKETTLLATTEALSNQLNQEKRRAQDHQTRLVADIRSGAQRLSIAAKCPTPAGQTPADTATADASGADAPRAELDPQTAETLVAIVADGDNAIRERNACIAAYNAARETLNAAPGH